MNFQTLPYVLIMLFFSREGNKFVFFFMFINFQTFYLNKNFKSFYSFNFYLKISLKKKLPSIYLIIQI